MPTDIPCLETERLIVRPFEPGDLEDIHRVLSGAWDAPPGERIQRLSAKERWLRWSIASYEQLASLDQPAYGDRAIVLKESGRLIGSVGLVPALGPFRQLPGFPDYDGSRRWYPEVGLFWTIDPAHQRCGFATEAARVLIDRAMGQFNLARVISTTECPNEGSMGVMRKLDMHILRNPLPEPEWFQIVGVLNREV